MTLWYGVLGPLEVRRPDGSVLPVGGARLRALLGLLIAEPGRVVPVDSLIDRLWDDQPPTGAANALQSLVSRLRGVLGADAIESTAAGYRLVAAEVDSDEFTRLARRGRRALQAGDVATAAEALDRALRLWRGPAANELPNRLSLDESRLAAVEDLAEARLALGQWGGDRAGPVSGRAAPGHDRGEPASDLNLSELVAAHPLRERLAALHIRSLYAAGHQAEALAAYEKTRQALADELGADPGPQLRELHLAMLRQDPDLAPTAYHTNLPAQASSFVGRDADLVAVTAALRRARLVTLVGAGGAGKTRLAVEATAGLAGESDVWLVELAPVTDPEDVPHAVVATLGIREAIGLPAGRGVPREASDATERLVAGLRGKRLLLLLDNCEHLIGAAAALAARLLADCPGVGILATSREPLGITGETLHPVQPLALPPKSLALPPASLARDGGAEAGPAEPRAAGIESFAAIRLFADRAAANQPGFAVAESNVADVVAICRRLDGMPLAIELAAARLRVLTVAQIAERLDDRFRLLTGGSRTALARHQTLRAVVDWSWDLLSESEQVIARRLSVFAGGVDLTAAERVAGADLDGVASLVDKSLLEADGGGRYRMLETIRAYAAERLVEAGEADQVRARYADNFVALAERADPLLRTRDQLRWLATLDAEHDNLVAVLRHALDRRDAETATRLVSALAWYWWLRGTHADARNWAHRTLEVAADATRAPDERLRVVRLLALGIDWPQLVRVRDQLVEVFGEAPPEQPRHPLVFMREVFALLFSEQAERALALMEAQLAAPDPWQRAVAYLTRGSYRVNTAELADAQDDLARAEAGFRKLGERWGLSQVLTTLTEIVWYAGDAERLTALVAESRTLAEELGYSEDVATAVLRQAGLLMRAGRLDEARAIFDEAMRIGVRLDDNFVTAAVVAGQGELARRQGRLAEARERYDQARSLATGADASPAPQFLATLRAWQARVAAAEGDLAAARGLLLEALADEQLHWDRPVTAAMLDGLALVSLAADDPPRAALLFGAAVAIRGMPDESDPEVSAGREAARRALGNSAYSREFQRGAALSLDEALAKARA